MKKVFLLAVVAIFSLAANAQVEKGVRVGVRADVGASNVLGEGDNFAIHYGGDFVLEYNFSEKMYLSTGLGFQTFAHKEESVDGTINAFNVTLPIHLGGRVGLGETSYLFFQAGPQLACGLLANDVYYYGYGTVEYYDAANRFDLGIGGRIGVEFKKLQISVGTNYGVLQASQDVDGYHNFQVNLGIGYMF